LDLSFVNRFGHTNRHIPWQRNVLARMYVGGPGTATSLHCAGVSNLFVQIYGQKKWVLISPRFTPFMYPAPTRGINWQSRVDFRDPDDARCPLYRFVDRYETVLEPGDVLWNPPFVWHGVMNLTESIAVSLWWTTVTRAFKNNVLLSTLTLCGRPNPIAMQLGFSTANAYSKSHFGVHLNR
jgi:cupin-like protein